MNITGFRYIVRGFSFLNASTIADPTIARSKIEREAGSFVRTFGARGADGVMVAVTRSSQ
jgi:hypothetical protein